MSTYCEIFEAIKKREFHPLYLFYGPEEYTKGQALSQMVSARIEEAFKDLNYHSIDGSTVDAGDIIASCETLPFIGDKRMIVVKDYPGLSSKKTGDDEAFKAYLQNIPESTCLIFYSRGDVDKGRILYKAIKKNGIVVTFDRLREPDLSKWMTSTLKKQGKQIAPADLQYFQALVGNRMEDIHNEMLKLAGYTGDARIIHRSDIDNVVTPSPEHTVFQLIDAISGRDSGRALLLLSELLEGGQAILGIITMLAKQLKTMFLCKEHAAKGAKFQRIQDLLTGPPHKLHPYAVKRCMEYQKGFTSEQLVYALSECLALDYGIKSGKLKDRLGIEMIIIKMSGTK